MFIQYFNRYLIRLSNIKYHTQKEEKYAIPKCRFDGQNGISMECIAMIYRTTNTLHVETKLYTLKSVNIFFSHN